MLIVELLNNFELFLIIKCIFSTNAIFIQIRSKKFQKGYFKTEYHNQYIYNVSVLSLWYNSRRFCDVTMALKSLYYRNF